jgi:Family of unknown function (DUF6526)
MEAQNYANHRQLVPMYHFVLLFLLVLTLIGAGVNLYESWGDHQRLYSASLILVLTVGVLILFFLSRIFALKAQDRAIRAEENLRHFVLTGKLLDSRLGVLQVVALRFAPDAEFPALAREAAEKGLSPDDIKKSIKSWRGDSYRV